MIVIIAMTIRTAKTCNTQKQLYTPIYTIGHRTEDSLKINGDNTK